MISLAELSKRMEILNGWSIEGGSIVKQVEHKSFKEAMDFANKVGEIAEKMQHHPQITINFNVVRIVSTTHDTGGLSEKDLDLAEEIDKIRE